MEGGVDLDLNGDLFGGDRAAGGNAQSIVLGCTGNRIQDDAVHFTRRVGQAVADPAIDGRCAGQGVGVSSKGDLRVTVQLLWPMPRKLVP